MPQNKHHNTDGNGGNRDHFCHGSQFHLQGTQSLADLRAQTVHTPELGIQAGTVDNTDAGAAGNRGAHKHQIRQFCFCQQCFHHRVGSFLYRSAFAGQTDLAGG